jgi:hypothetical protein
MTYEKTGPWGIPYYPECPKSPKTLTDEELDVEIQNTAFMTVQAEYAISNCWPLSGKSQVKGFYTNAHLPSLLDELLRRNPDGVTRSYFTHRPGLITKVADYMDGLKNPGGLKDPRQVILANKFELASDEVAPPAPKRLTEFDLAYEIIGRKRDVEGEMALHNMSLVVRDFNHRRRLLEAFTPAPGSRAS